MAEYHHRIKWETTELFLYGFPFFMVESENTAFAVFLKTVSPIVTDIVMLDMTHKTFVESTVSYDHDTLFFAFQRFNDLL